MRVECGAIVVHFVEQHCVLGALGADDFEAAAAGLVGQRMAGVVLGRIEKCG